MDVDAYDVIDLESDPLMGSDSTKTIQENMSLNDVETGHILNDADTIQPITEDVGPSNTQEPPTIGMKFDSEEKLDDYFKTYAYKVGFGVRRHSVRNEGNRTYYAMGCDKGGVHRSKPEARRTRLVTKTKCKAKINVIVYDNGKCMISRVFLEHNHALSPSKSRYLRSHKKMDTYTKRRLELNDCAGIPLNKNFHSLVVEAKGYENLPFGERECRNYIAKVRQLRLGVGDAEALRNYFVRMQRRNKDFFYAMDIDDDGRLQNVFWADARSRASYKSFGEVVSFDSTYLTNEYSMPFAPFVGVNHHGQSILFGCGLLSGEDKNTYAWLFKSWLECMDGHPPNAIITDQCPSMKVAVAQVFPEARHRLCLWHIMKKIPHKLGGYDEYKVIKKTLKTLVYESVLRQDFEDGWLKMIRDHSLEENEWLFSLFDDRTRWVPVYVKEVFWAGMSTTQRSESMNAFFDGYVNSKTSLRQFVEQYDNALKSKMEKENKADFDSLNSSYKLLTQFTIERQFHESYTNAIFKLFQDELKGMLSCNFSLFNTDGALSTFHVTDIFQGKIGRRRVVYSVSYNEVNCDIKCSCHLFEFRGIVCRHMMKILIDKDVKEIPSRYILSRWRKDIKHRHYYVTNCYEDFKSGEQVRKFDQLCGNFYEAAHIAKSQEKYEYLMKCIDLVKEQLTDESNWGVHATKSTQKLLSPFKVRGKGRPAVNRKISIAEKIAKRNQQKRKKNDEHGAKEVHIKEKTIKKRQQRKKKNNESKAKKDNALQDQRGSCLSNMTVNKVTSSYVNLKNTTSINGTTSFDGNSLTGNYSFDDH